MDQSIYDKLGGQEAFLKLATYFYEFVLEDPILKPYFAGKDLYKIKIHQAEFLAAIAGGPAYTRDSMLKVHTGLAITKPAFDQTIKYLEATFDHFKFDLETKNFFLTAAKNLESVIVEK